MEKYLGENLYEFYNQFDTDLACKKYLSDIKWEKGYVCKKCKHDKSQLRKDFSRTCNICSYTETATANTMFHKVKFGLRKAFLICFKMTITNHSISASEISMRYDIQIRTARMFMNKIRVAMKNTTECEISKEITTKIVKTKKTKNLETKDIILCTLVEDKQTSQSKLITIKTENNNKRAIKKIINEDESLNEKISEIYNLENFNKKKYTISPIRDKTTKKNLLINSKVDEAKHWIKNTYKGVKEKNTTKYLDEYIYLNNRTKNRDNLFHEIVYEMVVGKKDEN